jgi:hypothetical protein
MSYTWSSKTITNDNIVQSREYDKAVDTYVDTLNGGIDRDNLPLDVIDLRKDSQVFSVGRHWIFANCTPSADNSADDGVFSALVANHPRGNNIRGLRYTSDLVNGGGNISYWKSSTLVGVEEGMMTITYTQSTFIPKYFTYFYNSSAAATVARKYFSIFIKYNGVTVYAGEPEYQSWLTRTHTATFPVPAGDGLIEIGFYLPQQSGDSDLQTVLTFLSGQVVAFNRRR